MHLSERPRDPLVEMEKSRLGAKKEVEELGPGEELEIRSDGKIYVKIRTTL